MVLIKKYGIWLALLFTLIATVWTSKQEKDDEIVIPAGSRAASLNSEGAIYHSQRNTALIKNTQVSAAVNLPEHFTLRPIDNEVGNNIFSPYRGTQTDSALNLDSVNTTVSNPFTYAGKVAEGGRLVVFLLDGEKSHAVQLGDVIEDVWKIKSITPPTMTLKNIPLKVEIQMEIGANS
jgi:hypothetical protein